MFHQPLTREISAGELLTMREQGMTNTDIARHLDISLPTVRKYIGPTPAELTNRARQEGARKAREQKSAQQVSAEDTAQQPVPEPEPTEKTPAMRIVAERRICELEGSLCNYEVDTGAGSVSLKDGASPAVVMGELDRASLDRFIRELQEVRKLMGGV